MAITAMAMLVGIGLLVGLALAAARRHPRHAGSDGGRGSDAGDLSWMSAVGFDGGSADGGAADCGSAGDGGGCDGGGGGE